MLAVSKNWLEPLTKLLRPDQLSTGESVLNQHAKGESFDKAVLPDVVVFPESTSDVQKIIKFACEHSIPITPVAVNSSLEGHTVPVFGGISLDMMQMNKILAFSPEDLLIVVQPAVTYPGVSLQEIECPKCQGKEVEQGGYRVRKLRTLEGIQEPKVLKLRCRNCKKHLKSVYPEDTPRASWYSHRVHALMTVLSVHHVSEGCRAEVAEILDYPLTPKTQNVWEEARARRIEQQERQEVARQDGAEVASIEVASIDECKLGGSWAYTMTDTATDYGCAAAVSDKRNLFIVRDLVAVVELKAVISDGCPSIQAGRHWFPKIPHGRGWFHVILDVCRKATKEDRPKLIADLQVLYENETLPAAERWLRHLMERYDTPILTPLLNAWQGLKWWWRLPDMPLTNNTSEHLYGNLWARQKKRDKAH